MSDASDSEDIDAIREEKKAELKEQATTPDEPVHVESADHLDDLVADSHVLLVDFYADWCGPCKMLEPTVEEIAAETDAVVAKVDIDQHESLAQDHNVQGVPTLYLYVDGDAVEQVVGVQDKETLLDLIDQHS